MADDLSPTSDPAVTEWPSPAARLIIMVGPDPPGGHETGSGPPGSRTRSARQAQEPPEDTGGVKEPQPGRRSS